MDDKKKGFIVGYCFAAWLITGINAFIMDRFTSVSFFEPNLFYLNLGTFMGISLLIVGMGFHQAWKAKET